MIIDINGEKPKHITQENWEKIKASAKKYLQKYEKINSSIHKCDTKCKGGADNDKETS